MKFHDGTPLDAAAVIANLDRTRNPANGCRCLSFVQEIVEVKAIDPLTVEFVLKAPNAAFPTILADAPGIMVSPTAFKADPKGISTNPVGTGPFKFVEWIRGSRFVMTAQHRLLASRPPPSGSGGAAGHPEHRDAPGGVPVGPDRRSSCNRRSSSSRR